MNDSDYLPFFIYRGTKHTLQYSDKYKEAAVYSVDLGNTQYYVAITHEWIRRHQNDLFHNTFNHELDEVLKQ